MQAPRQSQSQGRDFLAGQGSVSSLLWKASNKWIIITARIWQIINSAYPQKYKLRQKQREAFKYLRSRVLRRVLRKTPQPTFFQFCVPDPRWASQLFQRETGFSCILPTDLGNFPCRTRRRDTALRGWAGARRPGAASGAELFPAFWAPPVPSRLHFVVPPRYSKPGTEQGSKLFINPAVRAVQFSLMLSIQIQLLVTILPHIDIKLGSIIKLLLLVLQDTDSQPGRKLFL